jgi:N-acetylglucosaminyl-diphospho-decaprenol L-rhamnosyltransferase
VRRCGYEADRVTAVVLTPHRGRATSASVHIVIVNWNTGDYLRDCLASIARSDRTGIAIARVTIVDNASSDESAERLGDLDVPLEIIRNDENVGFAAACNQGAAGSTADYLLFLNPDTRLYPKTLATVTRFMESTKGAEIGICGVNIVDGNGRSDISCSRFPDLRVCIGKMTGLDAVFPELFPGHHLKPAELRESRFVDQPIGAFYFVRRELFACLGGFDTRYFMYFEEVDFALRARAQGARSYFLKEATAFHAGNVSSDQVGDIRLYHSLRSRILFARRHWTPLQANLLIALTLTLEPAARLVKAALRRRGSDAHSVAAAYRSLVADLLGGRMQLR